MEAKNCQCECQEELAVLRGFHEQAMLDKDRHLNDIAHLVRQCVKTHEEMCALDTEVRRLEDELEYVKGGVAMERKALLEAELDRARHETVEQRVARLTAELAKA